ncbi:MAG: rod shape-determining protein RodA, partial [Candidatus Moranbacteria bacterium]|nr:rod shape-determining protein RodA [Candidatus Moranbacteria bacterium]
MKIISQISLFNFKLFYSILYILGFGLLAIYSISYKNTGFNNFNRQLLFAAIALFVFFVIYKINYGIWENYTSIIYLGSILLLIGVLFLGEATKGAVSWFSFYSYHIQPVELAKIALIILLAKYFSTIKVNDKRFVHVIRSSVYCLIPAALTWLQHDLGSASVLVGIWLIMVLNWGIKKKYLFSMLGIGIVIAVVSWVFVLADYQKERVMILFNPEKDPAGTGYHMIQSMTALGSGKIYGKGLGFGSQSQLHFLPEAHTDFIFAAIGEELGFLGITALMVGFLFLFYSLYRIAKNSADNFGRFITEGVMAMFFIQFIVNIG